MPSWIDTLVGLAVLLFTAGVSWGVASYRSKRGDEDKSQLMRDLKECVNKLQMALTELEVMKAVTARVDRLTEDHDRRIGALEIQVARTRKR